MRIQDLKIGVRLSAGFAILLILLGLMGLIGILRLSSIAAANDRLVNELLVKERVTSDWLLATNGNAIRAEAVARSSDPDSAALFQKAMDAKSASITALQKKLEGLLATDAEKQLLAQVGARRTEYIDKRKAIMAAKAAGNDEEAKRRIDSDMLPALNAYVASIGKVLDYYKSGIDAAQDAIDDEYRGGRMFLVGASVIALLAGVLLAWRLTVGITRPLGQAVDLAGKVAQGDLTESSHGVKSADETGQLLTALGTMQGNLATTITHIRQGAETIATASSEIASGNLDLSSRTEEQASSLSQTADAMSRLTTTMRQSADNADQANQLAASAAEVAARGGDKVHEVMQTMNDINASAARMTDIISVIDGIAFQTNILALNASVEAARAGEQGRGFAVVASEVRTLAQRSAAAAKEIKALIDDAESHVKRGSALVGETGTTMQDIIDNVQRVTDIMQEIRAATHEGSGGIEEVNRAIGEMDTVTQQNAALVEEAAAAAESLKDQAAALENEVAVFRLAGDPSSLHARGKVVNLHARAGEDLPALAYERQSA